MQLKYFNAICDFGTVSAAAEYLHVAQPSLSIAIKELEDEFGTLLFRRHHKGMTPTAEGEMLREMGREILERVEIAEKSMKEVGKNKKTLRLGVPPMIGSLILPRIYGDFVSQNKDIHLEITECGREDTCKRLEEGALDMAFISHARITDPGLSSLSVGRLEIVCGVARDNPIAKMDTLTPGRLVDTPLVLFKDGFFQSHEIKGWFLGAGIDPLVLVKTDQLSTMLKMISSNTAVGFLFQRMIPDADIAAVALEPSLAVDVSLVWKKDKLLFNSMKRFKEYLSTQDLFA